MKNPNRLKTAILLGALAMICVCVAALFHFTQGQQSIVQAVAPPTCPPIDLDCNIGYVDPILCVCVTATPGPPSPTATPRPWKGIAHSSNDAHIPIIEEELDAKWWYNWSHTSRHLSNSRYVPMVWCTGSYYTRNLESHAAVEPRDRTWLIFNEPDHPNQCNITATEAASGYDSIYDQIKAGSGGEAQIFVGGTAYLPTTIHGKNWWEAFLAQVQRPIEGIHIHAYPDAYLDNYFSNPPCKAHPGRGGDLTTTEAIDCLIPQLEETYDFFQNHTKTAGKPIWITETAALGNGVHTAENMRDNFMIPLLDWFTTNRRIVYYPLFEKLAWYTDYVTFYRDDNLLEQNGDLTLLGVEYKDW